MRIFQLPITGLRDRTPSLGQADLGEENQIEPLLKIDIKADCAVERKILLLRLRRAASGKSQANRSYILWITLTSVNLCCTNSSSGAGGSNICQSLSSWRLGLSCKSYELSNYFPVERSQAAETTTGLPEFSLMVCSKRLTEHSSHRASVRTEWTVSLVRNDN